MEENKINELVLIEQLPKLIIQTKEIGEYIDKALKGIDKLECNEENKVEVKKRRTEINNTLKVLEEKRKEIKKQIMAPYDKFNEIYENECKDKLQNASNLLGNKIDIIEKQQLESKKQELIDFFEQYKETYHLDFLNFENIKLNITLSASIKSLKDEIKTFCEEIAKSITLIQNEEFSDEIMLEFRNNGYYYLEAKLSVIERHKQLEELKEQKEKQQEIEIREQQVIEKVQEIMPPKEIIQDDELLESTFTVKATKDKLKMLIEFMKNNEIEVIKE